jgi:hypothetical protein
LIFWRGGRIFEPTKHGLNPRKHDFKKREAQDSLSEKEKQRIRIELDFPPRFWGIDFPPQFGECQYLKAYRVTYKTTNVIF